MELLTITFVEAMGHLICLAMSVIITISISKEDL